MERIKAALQSLKKREEREEVSPGERLKKLEEKYGPYGGLRALWLYVEEGKLKLPVDYGEALNDLWDWIEILEQKGVDPFKIIYPEEHAASSD